MTIAATDWKAELHSELVASRDGADEVDARSLLEVIASRVANAPIAGGTFTLTVGVWEGKVEHGVKFELVAGAEDRDAFEETLTVAIEAALSVGCHAIQRTDRKESVTTEWRAR